VLLAVALIETCYIPLLGRYLKHKDIVPVNIDHHAERDGCFVMVVLGEAVVSSAISMRNLSDSDALLTHEYYTSMFFAFLMLFCLALLYFHVQPTRAQHAYRRSRFRGISMLFANQAVGVALLALSVGIKLVMGAVADTDGQLAATHAYVLLVSLTCALLCLFVQRLLHWYGDTMLPPAMNTLRYAWWLVVFFGSLLPLLGLLLVDASSGADAVHIIAFAAAATFTLLIGESIVANLVGRQYASLVSAQKKKADAADAVPATEATHLLN
jgi:hypothetical protein